MPGPATRSRSATRESLPRRRLDARLRHPRRLGQGGGTEALPRRPARSTSRSRTTRSGARPSPSSRSGWASDRRRCRSEGDLADLRVYRRTLSPEDVRELAAAPVLAVARMPPARRSKAQAEAAARYYRTQVDVAWRRRKSVWRRLGKREVGARVAGPDRDGDGGPADAAADLRPEAGPVRHAGHEPEGRAGRPGLPGPLPAGRRPPTAWAWPAGSSSPENPLTARVAVNRLWQQHFGTGLVKTAENFGLQGEPPSHPELLDWLATEFVAHRLGREGHAPADRHQRDLPADRRRPRPALDPARPREPAAGPRAHGSGCRPSWSATTPWRSRDCSTDRLGGPSVKPYQPAGLWEELAGGAGEAPYVQDKGPRPLPPQPLRLPQADGAPSRHGQLRRPQPRDLPGQAGPHQHAAPGPRAAQRRDLRRGRPPPGPPDADRGGPIAPGIGSTFGLPPSHRADAQPRPSCASLLARPGPLSPDLPAPIRPWRPRLDPPRREPDRPERSTRLELAAYTATAERHPEPRRDDHAGMTWQWQWSVSGRAWSADASDEIA